MFVFAAESEGNTDPLKNLKIATLDKILNIAERDEILTHGLRTHFWNEERHKVKYSFENVGPILEELLSGGAGAVMHLDPKSLPPELRGDIIMVGIEKTEVH